MEARQGRAGQHKSASMRCAMSIMHAAFSSAGWSCGTLVLSFDNAECTQRSTCAKCVKCMLHLGGQSFIAGILCCSNKAGCSQAIMWDANNDMIFWAEQELARMPLCLMCKNTVHASPTAPAPVQGRSGEQLGIVCSFLGGRGGRNKGRKAYALSVKKLTQGLGMQAWQARTWHTAACIISKDTSRRCVHSVGCMHVTKSLQQHHRSTYIAVLGCNSTCHIRQQELQSGTRMLFAMRGRARAWFLHTVLQRHKITHAQLMGLHNCHTAHSCPLQ